MALYVPKFSVPRRALAVLLFAIPCSIRAQSLNDAFARLDKTAPVFKTFSADLRRVIHTAVINDDAVETGVIRVKRDKRNTRMMIDFKTPDAKAVTIDNAVVSIYLPKSKVVQVYDLSDKRGLIEKFLVLGFGASSTELKTDYDVSWIGVEPIGGQPTDHLSLIPKSKEVLNQLKRADLWIGAAGLPLQQKAITSTTGDYELATYAGIKLNPSLGDSALKLDLPKGVQIQHPGK